MTKTPNAKVLLSKALWEDLQDLWGVPFPKGYQIFDESETCFWLAFFCHAIPINEDPEAPFQNLPEVGFRIDKIISQDELGHNIVSGFTINFFKVNNT